MRLDRTKVREAIDLLREVAQNDEMIDSHYTRTGALFNEVALMLETILEEERGAIEASLDEARRKHIWPWGQKP